MDKKRSWFRGMYDWTVKWSKKPNAERALALLTAAEGIFFPIPTDPLLMAMTFSETKKWFRFAVIAIVASLTGGVVGYLVGWGLLESVGRWIINAFHLQEGFDTLGQQFQDNATVAVFTAAITPIPYKLITLTAGAFRINFAAFFIASVLGRGSRFLLVAFAAKTLGAKYKDQIEKYIDVIGIAFVLILVLLLAIGSR
jgi:membrane protein YqaA with SNARE-associated domain